MFGLHVCVLNRVWFHDPIDCSLQGSSVRGVFQARILEWVAISYSRMFGMVWQLWTVCKISSVGEALGEPFKAVGPHHLEQNWSRGPTDEGPGPEEGVLGYEPSVGITHGRLGQIGSYKCWLAVMALPLKAPYSPGWAAAAAWFCLMMVGGSHAPPGEGSWDAVLCHTPHRS